MISTDFEAVPVWTYPNNTLIKLPSSFQNCHFVSIMFYVGWHKFAINLEAAESFRNETRSVEGFHQFGMSNSSSPLLMIALSYSTKLVNVKPKQTEDKCVKAKNKRLKNVLSYLVINDACIFPNKEGLTNLATQLCLHKALHCSSFHQFSLNLSTTWWCFTRFT